MTRGTEPIVIGQPFKLEHPLQRFPLHVTNDWPRILAKIPIGSSLQVPVSEGAVRAVLARLTKKGIVKRFEYLARRRSRYECTIHHIDWFVGKPFAMKLPTRQKSSREAYWDSVFEKVLAGKSVKANASKQIAYLIAYQRMKKGKLPKKFTRTLRIIQLGEGTVRLCLK